MPLTKEDKAAGHVSRFEDVSEGGHYIVIKWKATGAWSCSCTDWIIRRAKLADHTDRAPEKNHCKHILRAMRGELKPVGGVVYLAPAGVKLTGRAATVAAGDEPV